MKIVDRTRTVATHPDFMAKWIREATTADVSHDATFEEALGQILLALTAIVWIHMGPVGFGAMHKLGALPGEW